MTTYILAGGNDSGVGEYRSALAQEVQQRLKKPPRVLVCLFASPREDWEGKFPAITAWMQTTFGAKTEVTFAFPDTFREQVQASDLVYIRGGDDTLLMHYLSQIDDIASVFDGKIVVGSSAGADVLASHYWAVDWREVRHGLGLLPINVIVHYESDYGANDPRGPINWRQSMEALRQVVGDDEVIAPLHEGECIVVEA